MTSASDKIRYDDFSVENILPLDAKGVHETLRKLQYRIYDVIKEVLQNALDSRDKGLPNRVGVVVPEIPKEGEPMVSVEDEGDSVTMDYDGNIQKFIEARKASSEKIKRRGAMGNKGIGMFQYTHIGSKVIITSMDRDRKTGQPRLIYRIPLYVTQSGFSAFGLVQTEPATPESMKEFGLDHPGTKVTFFDRDPEEEKIDEKELVKVLKDQYTVLLAMRPEVEVFINENRLELPKWIQDHPPKFIQRMSGAKTPEDYEKYDITGAIWGDENGTGETRLYVDGQLVQSFTFEARECTGYLNLNLLNVSSSRREILQDKIWNEFKQRVLRMISQFPKVKDDKEAKPLAKTINDMIKRALYEVLPPVPEPLDASKMNQKMIATGDPKGTGVIGYPITTTTPDPNRKKKKRKKHKRNNKNQRQIGAEGGVPVKKITDDPTNRREYPDYEPVNKRAGKDKPMHQLFKETKPAQLVTNLDNEEYLPLQEAKTNKVRFTIVSPGLSEIVEGIDEETRMRLSRARVKMMKALGFYPKKKTSIEEPIDAIRKMNKRA